MSKLERTDRCHPHRTQWHRPLCAASGTPCAQSCDLRFLKMRAYAQLDNPRRLHDMYCFSTMARFIRVLVDKTILQIVLKHAEFYLTFMGATNGADCAVTAAADDGTVQP
eukprot:4531819-Prymnesium_polylepis.1